MAAGLRTGLIALFGALLAACGSAPEPTAYLVRHAEKVATGDAMMLADPLLTEAGMARAELLAETLGDKGITAIWSSGYIRTRNTAAPLAAALGLEIQIYDARDIEGLAARLKAAGETALVVGHSNTTPQLAEALGGDAGTPIDEASEYDRLYVVSLTSGATQIQRFGAAYVPIEADAAGQ